MTDEFGVDPGEIWEIAFEYPLKPRSRYGHGRPRHRRLYEILAQRRSDYEQTLAALATYAEDLARIPVAYVDSPEPSWSCGWIAGLDIVSLYGLVRHNAPARYVEIGSGCSTKVVRRAIRDGGLATELVSVDPRPRAEVDALCDAVLRAPLEETDLGLFQRLGPGDVLFFDGSHRCFTNTDVTVMFLEVLPALGPGVHVGIHDVYLPDDYPPAWWDRFYSEQYLLAAQLLAGAQSFEVALPAWFVATDARLNAVLEPVWRHPALVSVQREGSTFWIRTR